MLQWQRVKLTQITFIPRYVQILFAYAPKAFYRCFKIANTPFENKFNPIKLRILPSDTSCL